MSSDIINNQMLKDLSVSTSQARPLQEANFNKRQEIVADAGKKLPPEETETKEATPEQAKQVVEQLNNHAQAINRDLLFSVDDDSGKTVIKVVNSETAELVRQIPSEEVLRLAQTIRESMDSSTGVIVQTSA